jgi:hypothetical protein
MPNTETKAISSSYKMQLFVELVNRPTLRHLSFREFVDICRKPAEQAQPLPPLRFMP